MYPLLALVVGYALGSIPFADLVGRLRGIDVRHEGSGNVGAANVGRLTGRSVGVVVLALDIAKALAALAIVGNEPPALIAAAWGVILGHDYPVWLRFLGGRGEAVSLVTGFALIPLATTGVFVLLVIGWFTNFLALGWFIGATLLPILAWFFYGPDGAVFAVGVAVLTYVRRLIGSPDMSGASFRSAWKTRLLHDREPSLP